MKNKDRIRQKIKKIEVKTKQEIGSKKYNIKPRFFIILIGVVLVVLTIVLFVVLNKLQRQLVVSESTNNVNIDYNKYSKELLEEYNKPGQKERFLNEYENIQNKIGNYIILNSTLDSNSFKDLIISINEYINSSDFEKFGLEKPTYFSGKYSVDESGIVKFKFFSKKIEPNFIFEEELKNKIILN